MPERNLDFDTIVNRRNTDCLKYDFAKRRGMPEDILPLWVADMDFKTSSYVEDALAERIKLGIFGYSEVGDEYFQAVSNWMKKYHDWDIEPNWMIKTPGVVFALSMAVRAYTEPGDAVLIQQPVYYPFSSAVLDNGRELVSSDLILDNNRYTIDFQDFEQKIIDHNIKLFLLCNPHNPGGRVWSLNELKQLGDICCRHHVIVVSDEIHNDIVWNENHTVFANVSKELQEISVICTSASKTFNLASMLISNIFIPNQKLRRLFREQVNAAGISQLSILGLIATQAAYSKGHVWYKEMMSYVKDNMAYIRNFTEERLPGITCMESEGTYLVWLDFRGTGLSYKEINDRIINKANLWLDSGEIFGKAGEGFQRINAACQRSILEQAMTQIEKAFC